MLGFDLSLVVFGTWPKQSRGRDKVISGSLKGSYSYFKIKNTVATILSKGLLFSVYNKTLPAAASPGAPGSKGFNAVARAWSEVCNLISKLY